MGHYDAYTCWLFLLGVILGDLYHCHVSTVNMKRQLVSLAVLAERDQGKKKADQAILKTWQLQQIVIDPCVLSAISYLLLSQVYGCYNR